MAFQAALAVLRGLDPVQASNFGAAVAGRFGPPLRVSRVAERNLSLAFPALDGQARRHLVRMMWESLGRTVAELPHLAELMTSTSGPGWEVAGVEILREQAARGGPAIFFSGHIGNWEMLPPILARLGVHMCSLAASSLA